MSVLEILDTLNKLGKSINARLSKYFNALSKNV